MSSISRSTRTEQAQRRAAKADLLYVNSLDEGITRRRCGQGFTYQNPSGKPLLNKHALKRINALVIPPAWEEVVICTTSKGHIQAVGVDAAGRRQYIYHERWKMISSVAKFDRMQCFGELLPKIRRRVLHDLNRSDLSRDRVLAAVVRLLDKAHLRVGNRSYAESNGAYGATTLLPDHVDVERTRIFLNFPGKSGQQREVELADAKVAKVVRQCEEIDGHFLFQYVDKDGECCSISSSDVNEALAKLSGESITAKDFRTWWGSVIALRELEESASDGSKTRRKKGVSAAMAMVARELGNTKAVCRSSYVHPGLVAAAESGELKKLLSRLPTEAERELTISETRFLSLLPKLDFT